MKTATKEHLFSVLRMEKSVEGICDPNGVPYDKAIAEFLFAKEAYDELVVRGEMDANTIWTKFFPPRINDIGFKGENCYVWRDGQWQIYSQ